MARPTSMYRADQSTALDFANMGIYGHPGIGKTALISSGGERTMIMDSDSNGTRTAKSMKLKPFVMPVIDFQQVAEAYEYVKHEAIPKKEFDWVWWDSLTLFQHRSLIDDILVDAHAANPRQSEDVASQREYLVSQNRIGTWIRLFADLPINFGFTAHVMAGEEGENSELIYKPAIDGKKGSYSSYICGYMNVVGYYGKASDGTRRLLTERSGHYYAKDRFHALRTGNKPFIDKPSMQKIEELLGVGAAASGSATAKPPTRRRRSATPAK